MRSGGIVGTPHNGSVAVPGRTTTLAWRPPRLSADKERSQCKGPDDEYTESLATPQSFSPANDVTRVGAMPRCRAAPALQGAMTIREKTAETRGGEGAS